MGDVLGAADDTAALLQNYLSMSYDAEKRGASASNRTSKVYEDLKLGTYTYERESVLLNTMWSTVSANEAIVNMGALFERYAFDKAARATPSSSPRTMPPIKPLEATAITLPTLRKLSMPPAPTP